MTRKWIVAAMLLALASFANAAKVNPQDAKSAIDSATKALGSGNLKTIEFTGSGSDYVIGQAPAPNAPWPRFIEKTYTRVVDLDAPASRVQRVRMQGENPPRGGGVQPVIGERIDNVVQAAGSPQAAGLQDDLAMTLPYSFLRSAAAASDSKVKSQTMNGKKYTVISFTAGNKAMMSGYFNGDNLLEKAETKIDNNVLGDIPYETSFSDYKDFGGVKFPTHIVQKQGGFPVLDLTVTDVKPNVAANIVNPAGKGGAAAPAAPTVTTEKLSDGMWLVLGNYCAIIADFKDYIVVVEGGLSDQRSEGIIAKAHELVPNKQIRYVINTHQHFDHSGGLRAYVAEGATVVTQEINKPYYEKIWANPHTIAPDKLSQNKKKPKFETVADKKIMTDGNHTIELYHLTDFGHNDGMLIAYLPKEKILVEADGFNPPPQPATQKSATVSPFTASLVANVERLKLDYDRIIPIHYPADSRKVAKSEMMLAVGR